MDPLSASEAKLVDELLFGPLPSEEAPSKRSNQQHDSRTVLSDKSGESTNSQSGGSGKGVSKTKKLQRLGRKGKSSMTLKVDEEGNEEDAVGACSSGSVVTGLSNIQIDDEPSSTSITSSTEEAIEISPPKTSVDKHGIPDIYSKNKELLQEAEHSRFHKIFKELSETNKKKMLKSSTVQKHLDGLALSVLKEEDDVVVHEGKKDSDRRFSSKDIVAALNGIHILCRNILMEPKYTNAKHPKIVALTFNILSSLAKGIYGDERRVLLCDEYGVLIVLHCLQQFPPSKELLLHEEGFIALYNMVQYEGNAIQFTECPQGLNILVHTMKTHKTRISIQKACLGILMNLASVGTHMEYIAKQHVFDLCASNLIKSCSTRTGQGSLQKVGCMFWRQVITLASTPVSSSSSRSIASSVSGSSQHQMLSDEMNMIIQAGVPQYLLDTMKTFGSNDTSVAQNTIASLGLMIVATGKHGGNVQYLCLQHLSDIIKIMLKHQKVDDNIKTKQESRKFLRTFQGLPAGSLKLSKSMIDDDNVRKLFQLAQIDPNQLSVL